MQVPYDIMLSTPYTIIVSDLRYYDQEERLKAAKQQAKQKQ